MKIFFFSSRFMGPVCSGFACDNKTRCIPADWKCDGHGNLSTYSIIFYMISLNFS